MADRRHAEISEVLGGQLGQDCLLPAHSVPGRGRAVRHRYPWHSHSSVRASSASRSKVWTPPSADTVNVGPPAQTDVGIVKATSEKANVTASPIIVVGLSEASLERSNGRRTMRLSQSCNSSSSEAHIARLVNETPPIQAPKMRDSTTKEKLSAPVAQGNDSSSLTTDFSIYLSGSSKKISSRVGHCVRALDQKRAVRGGSPR
jgi:hypothetical protein